MDGWLACLAIADGKKLRLVPANSFSLYSSESVADSHSFFCDHYSLRSQPESNEWAPNKKGKNIDIYRKGVQYIDEVYSVNPEIVCI
jgi:hypothetical protein